jgi:hypothetical protein
VYIVVARKSQRPNWLAPNDFVSIVLHEEIFPKDEQKWLPTFCSSAIESFVDRIDGLSEQFLYMNDDMLFSNTVMKTDFFSSDGAPKMSLQIPFGQHSCSEKPIGWDARMAYMWHSMNMNCALDKRFGAAKRYNPLHQAYPLTRSIMRNMRQMYPNLLQETVRNRFRNKAGVIPHYLALWTAVYQGNAMLLPQDQFPSYEIIEFYGHRLYDSPAFQAFAMMSPRPKLVCLGDFTAGKADTNGKGDEYNLVRAQDAKQGVKMPPWDRPNLKMLAQRLHNFYHSFVPNPAPWEVGYH